MFQPKFYIGRYLTYAEDVARHFREKEQEKIQVVVNILFHAWMCDTPVFLLGNGGSESTAKHFAADLAKTANDKPGYRGIKAFTPWDNDSLISAIVNDRPKEDIFTAWLDTYYKRGGVGVGISVHGGSGGDVGGQWSQNLLRGLQYIKDRGGKTIGFSGFDGGPMKNLVDVSLVVPVPDPSFGTPLVESFHVLLHHLVVFTLKGLIAEEEDDDKWGDGTC